MIQLPERITSAIDKLKIESLNEIQVASLGAIEKNENLVLLAPTGSGKTLGFLLPILNILKTDIDQVQAMVLAPSRELALQIEQVFRSMGTGFKVNCCYGGHPMKIEKDNLKHPPALLIGTPGRIADHLERGSFSTEEIRVLVLDEFDKSLEFGFENEMAFIISKLPGLKKKILTSATKMKEIPAFTGIKEFKELHYIKEEISDRLTLKVVRAEGEDKLEALFLLLCKTGNEATLVFCNHRDAVDRISKLLEEKGIVHDTFHGGLKQEERERALAKFRNGTYKVLVSTDLAARGLDIPEIQNVIHYQLPLTYDAFVHRNGRTARMYAKGNAWLLLARKDRVPEYIKDVPKEEKLPDEACLPKNPKWTTLYIGGGKKDKISKGDIVGLLLQKGNLEKDDVGLIEVQDFASFVAVTRTKARKVVECLREEKIKKKKVKIEISR